jgi:MoxR-like ATPase
LEARALGCGIIGNGSEWRLSTDAAQPITNIAPEVTYKEPVVMELKATNKVDSAEVTNVVEFIHKESANLRPKHFFMTDLKWKYLVRAVMRGKNIMMTGPSGTGKTMAVKHLVESLQRPFYYFNLGSTQDPRSTLIGNTHFKKDEGTYFAQSLFVSAMQTENAVILLDEISRAHPEAWNILMTVLDPNQKYLRLDEKDNSPTIKVANNVSFIATANIGNDYTSTRTMDRALLDRFITVEMDVLNKEEETTLLTMLYPTADKGTVSNIAEIADITRKTVRSENPRISTSLSTRATVEMGSLLVDGFNLQEIAEVAIYPFYSEDGGVESERTYMKQLVQKYITTTDKKLFDTNDANPL